MTKEEKISAITKILFEADPIFDGDCPSEDEYDIEARKIVDWLSKEHLIKHHTSDSSSVKRELDNSNIRIVHNAVYGWFVLMFYFDGLKEFSWWEPLAKKIYEEVYLPNLKVAEDLLATTPKLPDHKAD